MNSNQEVHSNVMKFGGLQYHPSDCQCQECRGASKDSFDEWLESFSEDNGEKSERDKTEAEVVSEERIRENEMLRCILEPYLNDVENIDNMK